MTFLDNSFTRRTLVQAVDAYSFDSLDVEDFLNDDLFAPNIKNRELFLEVFQKFLDIKPLFEDVFDKICFDPSLRSSIATAILKTFIAEFLLGKLDKNILLKEYLILLDSFSPNEVSFMKSVLNKFLEDEVLNLFTDNGGFAHKKPIPVHEEEADHDYDEEDF